MVNIKKSLDEGLENIEKGIVGQIKTNVKAVAGQMGSGSTKQAANDQGTNEAGQHATQQGMPQSDQQTDEVVNAFYAPSNPNEQHGLSPVGEGSKEIKEPSAFFKKQIEEGKTPEEAAKLEAIRNQLHKTDYFDPLINRKPAEEEHKEEEQEEKEEKKMEELQVEEKKKKDDDIAIKQAQQKTEKFPGASG
ncbi:MAG: hypothetical protein Q8Q49_02170 [bacterium]|nr:hypothetical protein [bacterium]